MSTVTADFGWFPLVPRPRPPALPLDQRITELMVMSARADEGTCQQRATAAAAVLNNAALIASDCGVPDLARTLCRRQYDLFAMCPPLPGWAARLALQPVLNTVRQLIRNGQGDDAHTFLRALHQAAADGTAVTVGGISVDFAALTSTPDARKEVLTLTWTALLADGTRALAQAGRWKEAASHAAANHGTGTRLLDGRQAAILALLTNGQPAQAARVAEEATVSELWERAVQAVLRVMCQHATGKCSKQETALMTDIAYALAKERDPAIAVTRTRIGLTACHLADGLDTAGARALSTVLLTATNTDAYAARDLLASPSITKSASDSQLSDLRTLIQASHLGTRTIPGHLRSLLTSAADRAAATLTLTVTSGLTERARE